MAAGQGGGDPNPDHADMEVQAGACPFCFLAPCIVTICNNAHWIGPGQNPSEHNPAIRKGIYYRFWSAIANLGGWNLPQYIVKKTAHGGGDPAIVYHRREIMPDCVLKFTRGRYPNPDGIPYMGHHWE